MRHRYAVYIVANRYRTVFYTGMTNDLRRRVWEHKNGQGSDFMSRYRVTDLLYYEEYSQVKEAIYREKQLKRWGRQKKLDLIQTLNPDMVDLAEQLW